MGKGVKGGHQRNSFKFCSDGIRDNANNLPECQKPAFPCSLRRADAFPVVASLSLSRVISSGSSPNEATTGNASAVRRLAFLMSERKFRHREPTRSVCVADCYFIVNVLDLPFASPIAIYR